MKKDTENRILPLKFLTLCNHLLSLFDQRAVGKTEGLVKAHQEYQRGLHAFEDWLEQEQEKLGCYTQLEGDVDMLEETLQKLQVSENTLRRIAAAYIW